MNKYNVGVHYEEGFSIEVTAPNVEEARKIAQDFVDEYCGVSESFNHINESDRRYLQTYHRDSWIVGES